MADVPRRAIILLLLSYKNYNGFLLISLFLFVNFLFFSKLLYSGTCLKYRIVPVFNNKLQEHTPSYVLRIILIGTHTIHPRNSSIIFFYFSAAAD